MATPQTSRFHDLLRRLTLAKDLSFPAVLEDLFPMVDLLADKPELFRGRGELPFACAVSVAAQAALVNRVWVMNKPSDNLVVVTHLFVGSTVAQSILGDVLNTGLPADVVNLAGGLDTRNADPTGLTRTRVTMNADTFAAAIAGIMRVLVAASSTLVLPVRVVLKPGFALRVQTGVVNTDLTVMAMGYERSVDATELS